MIHVVHNTIYYFNNLLVYNSNQVLDIVLIYSYVNIIIQKF